MHSDHRNTGLVLPLFIKRASGRLFNIAVAIVMMGNMLAISASPASGAVPDRSASDSIVVLQETPLVETEASGGDESRESETPTGEEVSPAETEPPTPSETPTPTVMIIEETATQENTPTVTLEASETATVTETPTLTPSATETPSITDGESSLTFTLSVLPEQAAPGDVVKYTLQIRNPGTLPVSGLKFSNTLPEGLELTQGGFSGFTYDSERRLLTWDSSSDTTSLSESSTSQARVEIRPGETLTLEYTVRVSPQADDSMQVIDTALLSGSGLSASLLAEAKLTVLPSGRELNLIDAQDSLATGMNERVQVQVPGGDFSVMQAVTVYDRSLEGAPVTETSETVIPTEEVIEEVIPTSTLESTATPEPVNESSATPQPAVTNEVVTDL